jgi:hypothetical protein
MIDLSLTSQQAIESIGDIVAMSDDTRHSLEELPEILHQIRTGFHSEDNWNITWKFKQDSAYTLALKRLRDAQESRGFKLEDTEPEHRLLTQAMKASCFHTLGLIYAGDHFTFFDYFRERTSYHDQPLTSLFEAHHNHVEHGTDYCSTGDVTVRFLGGNNGAVFFVEGGKPYDLKPMNVEEVEQLYAKNVGIDFKGRARTFDDLRTLCREGYLKTGEKGFVPLGRGYGKPVFSASNTPIVNVEDNYGVARTIILYPKDKCLRVGR